MKARRHEGIPGGESVRFRLEGGRVPSMGLAGWREAVTTDKLNSRGVLASKHCCERALPLEPHAWIHSRIGHDQLCDLGPVM